MPKSTEPSDPILKTYADRAGVILTSADGDQPGVMMNLYRFVRGIGVKPVLCGNIKGLHDPYRNPTTQEGFARQWGQNPSMVTSFADGTKISFENAIVANGTGMRVGQARHVRPDRCHRHAHPGGGGLSIRSTIMSKVRASSTTWSAQCQAPACSSWAPMITRSSGITWPCTSSATGRSTASTRLITCATSKCPIPWHAPYCSATPPWPLSAVRAWKWLRPPSVDLNAGDCIDGLGGYLTYGLAENSATAREQDLLPIGLAEGCKVKRALPKDALLTFADVELPPGRLCDRLWREQLDRFCPGHRHTMIISSGAVEP